MRIDIDKVLVASILLVMPSGLAAQNLRVRGSIGIGTFSPSGPLHIMGAAPPPSGLSAGNNGLLLGSSGENNSYKWIQSYSGPLVLNQWGNNVGIGTTNPAFTLDVGGIVRVAGNSNWTQSGPNALGLQFGSLDGGFKWIQSFESQPLILNGGGNRIGIGTTAPASALDIAGGSGPGLWVRASTLTTPTGAPGAGVYLGMGTVSPIGYLYAYDFSGNNKRDLAIQGGSGNVSVGHNSPVTTLDVGGGNGLWVRASGAVGNLAGGGAGMFLGSSTSDNTGYLFAYNYTNNTGQNLAINPSGGNVGIGTTTPAYKLHVNGTAAGTSWTNLSSVEYKENIRSVPESKQREMLDRLTKLELKTYQYKREIGDNTDDKIGFIAEDMPKEVLSADGKAVDLYELLAYAIGALKAQQEQIRAEHQEIERLRAELIHLALTRK